MAHALSEAGRVETVASPSRFWGRIAINSAWLAAHNLR